MPTRWERLRNRVLYSPHGERSKRAAELRDEVRRLLGYGRALRKVQRRRGK